MQTEAATQTTIRELQPGEDGTDFRTLNEEWIAKLFTIEPRDREILGDPETHILSRGGHVYLVEAEGQTVACVALIPTGDDVYEVSKMAVSPTLRGRGIGRQLLEHTIAEGRKIRAKSLFLRSSTKLENAVHLYESLGFHHVPNETLPESHYARADVFMSLPL
jgi:putative acetyltransferase